MEFVEFEKIALRDWMAEPDTALPSSFSALGIGTSLAEWRAELANGTALLESFGELSNRLGVKVAEVGVNNICGYPFYLGAALAHPELPVEEKLTFLEALSQPFGVGVMSSSQLGEEPALFMVWHNICDEFLEGLPVFLNAGKEGPSRAIFRLDGSDLIVHDRIFEILSSLTRDPRHWVQVCGLHGLGHSRHPKAGESAQEFIDLHKARLDELELAWCEECRDGQVL